MESFEIDSYSLEYKSALDLNKQIFVIRGHREI